MSRNHFLVGLGEVETFVIFIHLTHVLKADINFWRRVIAPSNINGKETEALKAVFDSAKKDIEN